MGLFYKKLLSERNFLKVQARARALMRDGSDLYAIYYKEKDLVFKTRSGTDRRLVWTQKLHLESVSLQKVLAAKSFSEVEDMVRNAELKVHCSCQAFHFWGYKYMAWKGGYGLEKETHRPRVRNPHEQGFVCKHLYLTLQLYPFWSKSLASKFKNVAEKERDKNPQDFEEDS